MGDLIKFFKSKKLDLKFSRFGKGQKLGHPSENQSNPTGVGGQVCAAEAAMARANISQERRRISSPEQQASVLEVQKVETTQQRNTEQSAVVPKVLFSCPSLFADSLTATREEVDSAIHEYLLTELNHNPVEAAVLLLVRGIEHSKLPNTSSVPVAERPTLGEMRNKRKQNIMRILQNLIDHPENATYRKLRAKNQLISDLLSISGMEEFLKVCKFSKEKLPVTDHDKPATTYEDPMHRENPIVTETYFILPHDDAHNTAHFQRIFDLLACAEPISPKLCRDTKLFVLTGRNALAVSREYLPDEYFCLSKEDLKRVLEQQQRTNLEGGVLMTKTMRERIKSQNTKLYRYALIRCRLPNDLLLQGVFYANERVGALREWICDCLIEGTITFRLFAPPSLQIAARTKSAPTTRVELNDDTLTLNDVGLAPCCVLTLDSVDDQQNSSTHFSSLIKPDLLTKASRL